MERAALFHHLPSGGGIRVASEMLSAMAHLWDWRVHCPEGSSRPDLGFPDWLVDYPFAQHARLTGARRLLAPAALLRRLAAFERVCEQAAEAISRRAGRALVHNSMVVAAPPVLRHLTVPSVYFCYEYPRHIYEPGEVRRTENPLARLLLAPLRSLERRTDRRSALAADTVVTFSEYMRDMLRSIYGVDANIVRPGVDSRRLTPSDDRGDYVLSVGALWPFKGHDLAIGAVAGIPPKRRPALMVVADRRLPGHAEELERLAAASGVELRLRVGIGDDLLLEAYRGARAVLCCAAREPYGLVPLEAMACARPVVAVDQGGFRDNVADGETGLLAPRRPKDIARRLESVLADSSLARRLGEAGRDFVTCRRRIDGAAERLAELLTEAG